VVDPNEKTATERPTRRTGDIRKDLSESQLAWIGSVTIAYNEAEILVDILLALSLKRHPSLPFALIGRINGVDGKIELLMLGFKAADESVMSALGECLGGKRLFPLEKIPRRSNPRKSEVLRVTGNDVKLAILITVTGMPLKRARLALESAGGFLRKAIA
jgi:hypothetical protein